jgi:hypothetical protein
VALLLEEYPRLTPSSARQILQTRANRDSYTGSVFPSARWGWGKLAVGTSVSAALDPPAARESLPMVLGEPYPNPVQRTTRLSVTLLAPALLHVTVFDVQGREVVRLQSGPAPAGMHVFEWRGQDGSGRDVPSGRYFVNFAALPAAAPEKSGAAPPEWIRQSRAVTILR